MCPERRRWLLAPAHDVAGDEAIGGSHDDALIPVRSVAQVRPGEVKALGLGQLHEVADHQAVSSHQRHALHAGHVPNLLDDEVALRLEYREEQHLGRSRSHFGQDRHHVRVTLVDSRERCHRPSTGLEGIGERPGQALGVGVTIVDGRRRGDAKYVEGKPGCSRSLVQVVVGSSVVAGVVVLASRSG